MPTCSTRSSDASRARRWRRGSAAARAAAAERWQGDAVAAATARFPGRRCAPVRWALPRAALAPAETYLQRGQISARGFDRVLRLAWTIADLAGRPSRRRRRRGGAVLPNRTRARDGRHDRRRDVLLARAYLSRVGEPASVRLWRFVARGRAGRCGARRCGPDGPRRRCSPRPPRAASAPIPHADLAAAERHGLRLVVPESAEWPHFAFAALERAVRARARRSRERHVRAATSPVNRCRRSRCGCAGPADLTALGVRSVGIVGARAATAYGEHVTAELAYGLAAARRRRRLRRRVRHRRRRAPRGARRRRRDRRRVGRRAGPAVPARQRARCSTGPPRRAAGLREPARVRAAAAAVPDPQPADRRVVDRGRRRRGRRAIRSDEHRRALPCAGSAADGGARSGHLADVCRLPRVAAPRDTTRPCWSPRSTTCSPSSGRPGEGLGRPATGSAPTSAPNSTSSTRSRATVFDGLPARRFARPEEVAARSGVSAVDVIRALPALDVAGLIEFSDGGYRVAARVRDRPR